MFLGKYPYTNDEVINLDWLLSKMKALEATVDSWSKLAEELEEGLADINAMKSDIAKLKADVIDINSDIKLLTTRVKALEELPAEIAIINSKIRTLEIRIDGLKTYIDNRVDFAISKAYQDDLIIMNKINQFKNQVEAELEDIRAIIASLDTDALNPWHGLEKESIQENINHIYEDLADGNPQAVDYMSLNLTAEEYSEFDLSAYEYARHGFKRLHLDYVYSPVYGFKQEISNVLTSIVNNILGTLSADEYAALNLTAQDYTDLDMSALDYYSYS